MMPMEEKPASDTNALSPFAPGLFRADDVRGRFGWEVDYRFAHAFGRALGGYAAKFKCRGVVVGRDARRSSVELGAALQAGIRDAGMPVIDIGMAPTPLAWFAARLTETGAAVSVTGGHDGDDRNGFKVMFDGKVQGGPALRAMQQPFQARRDPPEVEPGRRARINAAQCYVARLTCDVRLFRTVKIVLDCGNGVARELAAETLRELGCDVTEPPGLVPDTAGSTAHMEGQTALRRLAAYLPATDCELGVRLAGDGDRVEVVSRSGRVISPDRLALLLARDVLRHWPGARILHDVGASRQLIRGIRERRGVPLMCRGGEVQIASQMRATRPMMSTESNGRLRFRDRWSGHSDGLYAAARLLEVLSRSADAGAALDELPQTYATPEFRIDMPDGDAFRLIEALRAGARFRGAQEVLQVEGLRAEYDDGFGMVRESHAADAVVLRFEGETEAALARIREDFRRNFVRVWPGLPLPF